MRKRLNIDDNVLRLIGDKRDVNIDYLKGLAMIMVLLLHSIQMIDGLPGIVRKPILLGQIGVQLFFFCSGYLVIKPYAENRKTLDLHSSISFLRKKYVGLFVPFIIFLVIYLTINCIYADLQIDLPYKNNTSIFAVVLNVFLLHGFFPFCLNNVVPGGWYVGTLLILFATAPLIIRCIKKARYILLLSIGTSLFSVIASVVLHHFFDIDTSNGSFFYFSFLNQAPAYLIGMHFALNGQKGEASLKGCIFRVGSLILMIAALFYFEFSFSYALIPLLSALLFVDVYKVLSAIPVLVSKAKCICIVGQHTFVIYLSHFLVVWYIPLAIEKYFQITGVALWMIVLCLCVMLCMVAPYISPPMNSLSKQLEKALYRSKEAKVSGNKR